MRKLLGILAWHFNYITFWHFNYWTLHNFFHLHFVFTVILECKSPMPDCNSHRKKSISQLTSQKLLPSDFPKATRLQIKILCSKLVLTMACFQENIQKGVKNILHIVGAKSNWSGNGITYNLTPKTDCSKVNFSKHSVFLEKCQLQKYIRISSSLKWFLLEICGHNYKSSKYWFSLFPIWGLTKNYENFQLQKGGFSRD